MGAAGQEIGQHVRSHGSYQHNGIDHEAVQGDPAAIQDEAGGDVSLIERLQDRGEGVELQTERGALPLQRRQELPGVHSPVLRGVPPAVCRVPSRLMDKPKDTDRPRTRGS